MNATLNGTSFVLLCTGAKPSETVKMTTYYLLMIIALVGNLLIVVVFYRNKSLKITLRYLIVNMAVSDLIVPVTVLPRLTAENVWYVDGVQGSILCKFVNVVWEVSNVVSIISMVMIAVDRFHAVLFAMKPALITRKTCLKLIVVIWISSLAFRWHLWNMYGLFKDDNGTHCVSLWGSEVNSMEEEHLGDILWMCLIFVSAITLTVLYSSISISLYRQKSTINLASEIVQ